MVVADPTAVKVYTVNGAAAGSASSLPDWLTRKRAANGKGKRVIREQVEGTIELIQHFEFPEASNRIKTTRDGHHVIATGTYKPQMRVWDLDQLSLKFERHSDAENVEFIILSDDWTKTLHLQADRTIELHTQGGFHYRTRIPRFGRSLAYHFPSCDALVGASGNEVYRLNLDQGRFLNPLTLGGDDDNVEGVNAIDINAAHGLWAFGLDGSGTVEFWDHRSRTNVGTLHLPRSLLAQGGSLGSSVLPGIDGGASAVSLSVTALSSRSDGLSYAVGTSTGHTLLYDIRSPRAFATKDQGYGLPVKKVMWMEGGSRMAGDGLVLSADKKVVKIWDRNNPSANFASLTPATDLNDIHHVPGSGLLMTANEGIQMTSYYIPQLGPAPRWCSFVENLTEEMEEGGAGTRGAYEDFKFVSRAELTTLGLDHLAGTPALKPYMHGYFISLKLYDAARVIANPYVYEEQRDKMVQAKLDKLAEGRIRARKDQQSVKVNKALADKVARDEERARKRKARKDGDGDAMAVDAAEEVPKAQKGGLLADERFKALFEDPEFEVDQQSREFALLNPSTVAQRDSRPGSQDASAARRRTAVESEEEESDKPSSDEDASNSDSGSASEDSSDAGDLTTTSYKPSKQARRPPQPNVRMVPLRAHSSSKSHLDKDASFGQRRTSTSKAHGKSAARAESADEHIVRKADGTVEMSWIPSSSGRHERDEGGGRRAKTKDTRKGVERFGAGMERGGEDPARNASEAERSGRKERRKGVRSGSKNAFRGL